MKEAGGRDRGEGGQKKEDKGRREPKASLVEVCVFRKEGCVACALINRSPYPLGPDGSTDTMNNSQCPLALAVTWQRDYN